MICTLRDEEVDVFHVPIILSWYLDLIIYLNFGFPGWLPLFDSSPSIPPSPQLFTFLGTKFCDQEIGQKWGWLLRLSVNKWEAKGSGIIKYTQDSQNQAQLQTKDYCITADKKKDIQLFLKTSYFMQNLWKHRMKNSTYMKLHLYKNIAKKNAEN